jgi:hypothetical protein
MTRRFAREVLGIDLDENRDRFVFFGDSPNDEPMFRFFPLSIGVANVRDFTDRMKHLPACYRRGNRLEGRNTHSRRQEIGSSGIAAPSRWTAVPVTEKRGPPTINVMPIRKVCGSRIFPTIRSIFKWGNPRAFHHPDDRLVGFIKEVFGVTENDLENLRLTGTDE